MRTTKGIIHRKTFSVLLQVIPSSPIESRTLHRDGFAGRWPRQLKVSLRAMLFIHEIKHADRAIVVTSKNRTVTPATALPCSWSTQYKAHIPLSCKLHTLSRRIKEVIRVLINNPTLSHEKYHLNLILIIYALTVLSELEKSMSRCCDLPLGTLAWSSSRDHFEGSMASLE